jgi:hypothetical protein
VFQKRPETTEAVENQSRRSSSTAWLVLALALLVGVLLFRAQISDALLLAWDVSMGPLVEEDWQQAPPSSGVPPTVVMEPSAGRAADENSVPAQDTASSGASLVTVPLGANFRPVNFEISAASMPLVLDGDDEQFFKPQPGENRYGHFTFRNGRTYRFEIRESGAETVLSVDLNGDGDFASDGAVYRSPTDAFEITVSLPMEEVTGKKRPGGEYRLWLYRTPDGRMQQVALTQLTGKVYLGGRSYTAYVVENHTIDGDFSNDGIYLDLDRNGRIHPDSEFVPQGGNLALGDNRYAFLIRR